jgi:membrane protein YdbS with pleckstrin-like domain
MDPAHPPTPPSTQVAGWKVILTCLFLFFFSPFGIILMWIWMRWPIWLKVLVTLFLLIVPILIILAAGYFVGYKF